jgi:hypothetical protein
VYCKDSRRTGTHENVQFDFLGYTFRPREIVTAGGRLATGFTPAVSRSAMTAMRQTLRRWHLQHRSELSIDELARFMAPRFRGWMGYYCRFRGSEFQPVANHLDRLVVRWAMRKYTRLGGHPRRTGCPAAKARSSLRFSEPVHRVSLHQSLPSNPRLHRPRDRLTTVSPTHSGPGGRSRALIRGLRYILSAIDIFIGVLYIAGHLATEGGSR